MAVVVKWFLKKGLERLLNLVLSVTLTCKIIGVDVLPCYCAMVVCFVLISICVLMLRGALFCCRVVVLSFVLVLWFAVLIWC